MVCDKLQRLYVCFLDPDEGAAYFSDYSIFFTEFCLDTPIGQMIVKTIIPTINKLRNAYSSPLSEYFMDVSSHQRCEDLSHCEIEFKSMFKK